MKFKSEYGRPKNAWNGHGLEGELELEGGLECGTDKAVVVSRVETDGKPMEFLEGSLTFETSLNPIFARKSRVKGGRESFDF